MLLQLGLGRFWRERSQPSTRHAAASAAFSISAATSYCTNTGSSGWALHERQRSGPADGELTLHRVGGELALTPLPHHRTCGSAYGGSTSTLESLLLAQQ